MSADSRVSSVSSFARNAVLFAAIVVTGLAACSSNVADPDLWGHIQYGREVLRDRELPRTTTWSYAAEGATWVNHENIAELALAAAFDSFGNTGLTFLKLLIGALLFSMMVWSARKSGAGWIATLVIVAIVGTNIQFHWHFRPQIFTYLSLAALLALWQFVFASQSLSQFFESTRSSRRLHWLWLQAPLMCFWANSHGGFAAGLAILCSCHGLISLQCVWTTGWTHARSLLVFWMITLAAVAASLLNPYGLGLWKFMYAALKLPRPEIADWGPLNFLEPDAIRFWCLLIISATGLWAAVKSHQRFSASPEAGSSNSVRSAGSFLFGGQNLPQLVVFFLLMWQGISHCRHLSIVAIVFGFWMPQHFQRLLDQFVARIERLQATAATAIDDFTLPAANGEQSSVRILFALGLLTLCAVKVISGATTIAVDRNEYPVNAMQFLSDHRLQGRTLVTFNWAQYAIGCFGAADSRLSQSRVGVDGRFETCYPREITDVCFDFWLGTDDPTKRFRSSSSPDFDPVAALNLHSPDLVLLSRYQMPSVRMMAQQTDDWVLLYQDSLAQLWGRRQRYDDEESPHYFPPHRRQISDALQKGDAEYPALPAQPPINRLTNANP